MNTPLWFSLWSFPAPYVGNEPAYVDETEMRCSQAFTMHAEAIRSEVLTYLKKHETIPYFKQSMVQEGKGYHTQSLAWWGIKFHKNQRELPVLSSILTHHPELLTLSINVLDSNSNILPHKGIPMRFIGVILAYLFRLPCLKQAFALKKKIDHGRRVILFGSWMPIPTKRGIIPRNPASYCW